MVRAAIPRGTKASPPRVRPVCRRCGTLRGRIAHATLFSGTRPRCRTRQEWKYTGTRGGRLTRRSAFARFGEREMRPRGRVAHYMDTFPEVTSFTAVVGNRDSFARYDRPGGGTDRSPTRGVPPFGVESDRTARARRWPRRRFRIANGAGDHMRVNDRDDVRHTAGNQRNVPRPVGLPIECPGARTRLVASASIAWRTKMPESA